MNPWFSDGLSRVGVQWVNQRHEIINTDDDMKLFVFSDFNIMGAVIILSNSKKISKN